MKIQLLCVAFMLISTFGRAQSLFGINSNFFTENAESILKGQENYEDKKHFYLYTAAAFSSTEKVSESLTATQRFEADFIIRHLRENQKSQGDLTKYWGGISIRMGLNALNLKPTSVPADSIDIQSLMFPETGNFGYILTPRFIYSAGQKKEGSNKFIRWTLGGELSFALRQTNFSTRDTTSTQENLISGEERSFSVLNYNIAPFTASYAVITEDVSTEIGLSVYANFLNVPDEDVFSFNELFPREEPFFSNPSQSGIFSVGCKTSVTINRFGFFLDIRHSWTQNGYPNENPITGFAFNYGLAADLQVLSR